MFATPMAMQKSRAMHQSLGRLIPVSQGEIRGGSYGHASEAAPRCTSPANIVALPSPWWTSRSNISTWDTPARQQQQQRRRRQQGQRCLHMPSEQFIPACLQKRHSVQLGERRLGLQQHQAENRAGVCDWQLCPTQLCI